MCCASFEALHECFVIFGGVHPDGGPFNDADGDFVAAFQHAELLEFYTPLVWPGL